MTRDGHTRWGLFYFGIGVALLLTPLNDHVVQPLIQQASVDLGDLSVTLISIAVICAFIACVVAAGKAMLGRSASSQGETET